MFSGVHKAKVVTSSWYIILFPLFFSFHSCLYFEAIHRRIALTYTWIKFPPLLFSVIFLFESQPPSPYLFPAAREVGRTWKLAREPARVIRSWGTTKMACTFMSLKLQFNMNQGNGVMRWCHCKEGVSLLNGVGALINDILEGYLSLAPCDNAARISVSHKTDSLLTPACWHLDSRLPSLQKIDFVG